MATQKRIEANRRNARASTPLGLKQLQPTTAAEYIAKHKVDDLVTGRVVESQIRSFRISALDPSAKRIELELAG